MTANIQFISAGAGSGKTYTITEALNNALLAENFSPDSIFATTFTKKAAQELLQRVREKVLQTVAEQPEQHALALQINQAKIGTLHSLCAIYVERFAFELGLSPKLNIIDEQHAEQLLYEVFEQLASDESTHASIERALTTGLRFGFGKASFYGETTIVDLAVKLVQEARANAITPSHFNTMALSSWSAYESLLPVTDEQTKVTLAGYLECAKSTVRNLEQIYSQKNKSFPVWLKKLKNSSFVEPQRFKWSDWETVDDLAGKTILPMTQTLLNMKGQLAACVDFRNDLKHFIEDIFTLAEGLALRYQTEKRKIGYIDYGDLEAYFLEIIHNPDYLQAIAPEFAFVMVDEFQDTNPMQLAIYSQLFRVARKVILVGDLKQAIYGFRGASPELMALLIDKLREQGQTIDALEYSWRSTKQVLDYCNQLFTQLFKNNEVALKLVAKNDWQVPSEQFLPAVSHWPLAGDNAGEYANDLCLKLQQIMQKPPLVPVQTNKEDSLNNAVNTRPLSWRDIAILENSNADIRATVAALQQAGIPAVAEQAGLTEQAEVIMVLAALQLVAEPTDTLAKAEFVTLYQQDGLTNWLKTSLQPESNLPISETAAQVLAELHQSRLHFDPAELLSLVVSKLKLADVIVSWDRSAYQSEQRLANLDALLRYAQDYCQLKQAMRLPVNINGFFNFLKQKAKKDLDLQQGSAGDAVQVMTIHAAKGLEWPMVIANFLDKQIKHRLFSVKAMSSDDTYQIAQPLQGRWLRFLPSYKASRGTIDNKDSLEKRLLTPALGAFEVQQALSEAKREIYVALTRAKHYLVLTSLPGKPANFSFYDQFPEMLTGLSHNLQWQFSGEKPIQAPLGWRSILPLKTELRKITPSAEQGGQQLYITDKQQFGQILTIPKHVSANRQEGQLGDRIHQLLAWAITNTHADLQPRCEMLLQDFGITDQGFISGLSQNLSAFIQYLKTQAIKSWQCELPINVINHAGQEITGTIDLLLQLDDGWLIIDHKLFSGNYTETEYLENYAGQLLAYREALQLAGIANAKMAIHAVTKGTLYLLDNNQQR